MSDVNWEFDTHFNALCEKFGVEGAYMLSLHSDEGGRQLQGGGSPQMAEFLRAAIAHFLEERGHEVIVVNEYGARAN